MLKKINLLRKRYVSAKTIGYFDQKADSLYNASNCMLPSGYLTGKIDDFLGVTNLSKTMANSSLKIQPNSAKKIHLSWDVPTFVWEALLNSKKLESTVINYLGPDVRLDDLYIKTVMDGLQSVSEGWHDDNVGYRLKFFMVFDVDGEPAGTVLIPKSRPSVYSVNLKDELKRMNGLLPRENRYNEIQISYSSGDFLLFDTNLEHRGDYSSGTGTRYCVIAEFIDRHKGNALRGKAPCGPGQSQRHLTIPKLGELDLTAHKLMDQSLLKETENGFSYGY